MTGIQNVMWMMVHSKDRILLNSFSFICIFSKAATKPQDRPLPSGTLSRGSDPGLHYWWQRFQLLSFYGTPLSLCFPVTGKVKRSKAKSSLESLTENTNGDTLNVDPVCWDIETWLSWPWAQKVLFHSKIPFLKCFKTCGCQNNVAEFPEIQAFVFYSERNQSIDYDVVVCAFMMQEQKTWRIIYDPWPY